MVCTRAASFWFGASRSMGILGRMSLVEVGFYVGGVWLGECILGRSGENEVVGGFGWSGGGFGWGRGGKSCCLGR